MRSLNKNKQRLLYSNQLSIDPIYETDENGDIVYDLVDGEYVPRLGDNVSTVGYSVPKEIYGNIHSSGGQAEAQNYGVSTADYDAVLYTPKGEIELTETSLVWYDHEPVFLDANETEVDATSADYKVYRVPPCLDERVYLLKRVDK